MKKRYFLTVQLYALLFLAMLGVFLPDARSQSNEQPSVGPSEHFFDSTRIVRQKPTQYLQGITLNLAEMHVLGALTSQERKIIEESVDPPAIGVVRDLNAPIRFSLKAADIPAQGEQRSVSGGRLARINADTIVWTTYIKSEQAEELRVFFSEGNFPAGVSVNLFSKDNYSFNQHELHGKLNEFGFYTTTTFSDYVNIQVVIPINAINEHLYFVIAKVIHANNIAQEDAPLDCFQDVNCAYANSYANIGILKASTSKLRFVKGGGYYLCTGSLLNDSRAIDLQPFLLTAHHCFDTQASAASLEARFDLFSTSCNGPTNTNTILINGSNLLSTNSQTDVTMVLLNDNPGGTRWYLGWNANPVANGEVLHSVHHPSGNPQTYQRVQNKTSPAFTCTDFSTANFMYTTTLGGQFLPGSSGGNVVLPNAQVVGQMYGWCYNTSSECDYPNYYNMWGRFDVSYSTNNFGYWLNNGGSSVYMSTSPASSVNFGTGNAWNYYYQNVTVTNNGYAPYYLNLEAGNSYISGADASQFTITGGTFLYLDPGTSGTITVRFNPTSAGAKTATLYIPHNANNTASPYVITLSGSVEPCSDVISMGSGGEVNAKTYSKSGTGIWYTSWVNACGYFCPGNEQIYSFTAPYTGYYSIQVTTSNNTWVDYMWKTGTCESTVWNCFDDVYSPGIYGSAYMYAGTTYYILADAETTSLATQTFHIMLNPCQNTTPIAGTGAANSVTYSKTGDGGWFTNGPSPCGYYCPGMEEVYTFTAPFSGYYSIQVTDASSWVDYMWSTSCGSAGWNCIDDIFWPGAYGSIYWTAGTTYYILLDGENTNSGPHTFYINPPNPCLAITSMACNQAIEFPGGGTGVWNTDVVSACGYFCPGLERIYSFVAPTTGQYSLKVNNAYGWADYMWSTSCSPDSWTCINDIISPGQYGSMSWTAGTTYYILVDDEDTNPGIHSFQIVCPELCHACPIYDFQIDPYTSWQTSSSSIDSYGCKNYRFYAWTGFKYTFKTGCGDGAGADFDTYLQLFDENGCAQVAYNDDGCGYPLSKIEWTPATNGYHTLKVLGYSNYFGSYTLAYNYCYLAPGQPGPITGPSTVANGIAEVYTITDVPEATSYTWSYSGGGTITAAGTSATLTATSSGILSVTANNLCGSSTEASLSIAVISLNLSVTNTVIIPGASECFAAAQTITVAGGGTYFYVLNGGSAEFVAGQNILFMPGVTVYNGGYMLGRIATNNDYCAPLPVVAKFAETTGPGTRGSEVPNLISGDAFFKVYPNPTTGKFTLELSAEPAGTMVKVQCYNLLGALIMEKEFDAGRLHEFTLIDQSPGLYVLKVVQDDKAGMQKIIKQ